ncbi:MAG: N-methyl-L-tryptophan oxidase [Burkholderiales bacterium]|nr:N-methyl-L-tryptophan oxidase [Burkholderiales bacterium]
MSLVGSADVAVVGLGAVGSAVARHLAEGGARVIGLDRFRPPHDRGSSHGSTRITRLAIGEGDAFVPIVQRSHALWRELEARTGETLMTTTGGLVIASAASDARPYHGQAGFFEQTVRAAERFGIAHERLSAHEIRRQFPAFMPADDERGYWERDAGILVPERCVAMQLQQAAVHGADLRYGVDVSEIAAAHEGGGATLVTDSGPVVAAHVVLATGAWLPAMLPAAAGARFAVQRQVLHWFATDMPVLYEAGRCPVFIWMHGGEGQAFYGFPKADAHAGVKVATEQAEHVTTPEAVQRAVSAQETARTFDTHVRGRLRSLSARSVHDATCLYTSTADGRFVIDRHPTLANVTVVSACSGHGFKHSAAVGEAVADGLLGKTPRVDLSMFATLAG